MAVKRLGNKGMGSYKSGRNEAETTRQGKAQQVGSNVANGPAVVGQLVREDHCDGRDPGSSPVRATFPTK